MRTGQPQIAALLAFSLVELSIVLVILGLLVGGVLSGKSLIRASELRSSMNKMDQFRTATYTFRDKYFALPGDVTNAHSFWSTSCATLSANCNGNGDSYFNTTESLTYWQHLALASMIEGTYTGTSNGALTINDNALAAGTNVPKLPSSQASVVVDSAGASTSTDCDRLFQFGLALPNSACRGIQRLFLVSTPSSTAMGGQRVFGAGAFSTEDGWNIDTKQDDGLPSSGKVMAIDAYGATASSCVSSSAYNLTTGTTKTCVMAFLP